MSIRLSTRLTRAFRYLISGEGGVQDLGFIAKQKRTIKAASILSVLVLISSFWPNPLMRAGLTILAV
jgi:hypothetical protein